MDNTQLVTIAETTAVITIIGGMLKWVGSRLLAVIQIATTSESVKTIFKTTKRYAFLWDVLWLALTFVLFVVFIRDKSPITRWTILYAAVLCLGTFMWSMNLLWDIISTRIERRRQMCPSLLINTD